MQEFILKFKPEVICVENNASFGLRSISVPYNSDFDRHEEHKSGWYYGASITAFNKLHTPEYLLVKNIVDLE